MKTPREVLLQQHHSATPKLDALRASVVGMVSDLNPSLRLSPRERGERGEGEELGCAPHPWRDLVRSVRWHLAGLAAAWVVVAILQLDMSPGTDTMVARGRIPPAKQLWASVRENRRLLLLYSDAPTPPVEAIPGRRSEIEPKQAVV